MSRYLRAYNYKAEAQEFEPIKLFSSRKIYPSITIELIGQRLGFQGIGLLAAREIQKSIGIKCKKYTNPRMVNSSNGQMYKAVPGKEDRRR